MLHFVWLDDRHGASIAQLSDADMSHLESALLFLKSETGVHLDTYSDTRLAPDHANLLLSAIGSDHHVPNIKNLVAKLHESVRSNRWMLGVGD